MLPEFPVAQDSAVTADTFTIAHMTSTSTVENCSIGSQQAVYQAFDGAL